jgi:hypothetical protein
MTFALKITTRLIALIATISFTQVKAQTTTQWGEWYQLSDDCQPQPCGAAVSFLSDVCKNGTVYHNGLTWRFRNDKIQEGAYIKFKFDHRKCDGSVATDEVTLYLEKTGVWNSSGDLETANSYELASAPIVIKRFDPNKDKAKGELNEVNDIREKYNKQYNDAIAVANKLKDATKHNQFMQQINANKDAFHQLVLQAQDQMNKGNGDALAQTLNLMKQQQDDLHTIYLQIDPDEPITAKNNATTNNTNKPVKVTTAQATTNTTTVNTNTVVLQQTPKQQQTVQTLGALSNSLTNYANAYGTAIETNYANWKIASENAFAIIMMVKDSVNFYRNKAQESIHHTDPNDTLLSLQSVIQAHWFHCQSEYNGSSIINNTKYGGSKDITTGDYISFKYNAQFSADNTRFNFVALERYTIPDVLFMPICRLSDTKIARKDNYRRSFGYISDCKRCSNLRIAGGQNGWLTESIKCTATEMYDEIAAINAMQQNLYDGKVDNNIDLLDYATTRAWYNNLKLKNAKTIQDITDLLKANEAYLDNSIKRSKTTLGLNERRYSSFADIIANYYLACAIQVYCSTTKKYTGVDYLMYLYLLSDSDDEKFNSKKLLESLRTLLKAGGY